MRQLFIVLLLVLTLSALALAETQQGTYEGQINGIPIGITKDSDMSFTVLRVPGQSTYNTFATVTTAKFLITADVNEVVILTYPESVTLTRQGGSETASTLVVCRKSQTAYPTSAAEGDDCGTVGQLSSDGKLYIAFFPSQITFYSDIPGTYVGQINITVEKQ